MEHEEETQDLLGLPRYPGFFGKRRVLAILGFLGFCNVYAMRVNLSVAIVAMVNNTAIPKDNSSFSDTCPAPEPTNTTLPPKDGEFIWDEPTQGMILSSFFWGYIVTNLIGGRLGEIVGGKFIYGIGVLLTSVFTLLTPVTAQYSTTLFIVLRVLEGLGEGVTYPAMNAMLAKWIPPLERSQTIALVFAGSQFGTIVAMPISGYLCDSSWLGGWPAVFYVFGTLGIIWFIFWVIFVYDKPSSHPWISNEERTYIETSLSLKASNSKALPIPWYHILTSMPFWAIVVSHFGHNWGFYMLLTELPTYLKTILHFNMSENGVLSALPYLVMFITSLIIGTIMDWLRSNNTVTTTTARRISNAIGIYGPMICLIILTFTSYLCDSTLAIVLLTFAVGLNGGIYSGVLNSPLDIAANYGGTILGITNGVATIPGFLAPQIVGLLTNGKENNHQWNIAFWIAIVIYFCTNTFYLIFVSGEEQPWNRMYEQQGDPPPVMPSPNGSLSSIPTPGSMAPPSYGAIISPDPNEEGNSHDPK
ncbi:putative inorganic phosphate cotransporter isoform X2 [Oratosquilla oratoria]|uniref:putative inorganic phosphate cotransporter isoform X2 n=1 Tax=Oratosquilla oratoria TaxID=337810 RepID=UPI003F76EF4E